MTTGDSRKELEIVAASSDGGSSKQFRQAQMVWDDC